MYVKHRQVLREDIIKKCSAMIVSVFHFPQGFFSSCSVIYMFPMVFSYLSSPKGENKTKQKTHHKTNEKRQRQRQTDTLTTSAQSFQKFLPPWNFFKTVFLYGFPHELIISLYELLLCYSYSHQWKCYLYVKGPFQPSFKKPFLIFLTKVVFLFQILIAHLY